MRDHVELGDLETRGTLRGNLKPGDRRDVPHKHAIQESYRSSLDPGTAPTSDQEVFAIF
jgi:hypothetical protein